MVATVRDTQVRVRPRSGEQTRIVALRGLIDHIEERGSVWFATHETAARYVREQAGME